MAVLKTEDVFAHWQRRSQADDRSSGVAAFVHRKEVMARNGFHCRQEKKKKQPTVAFMKL